MVNPSKYIRLSIIHALNPIKAWANRVPKNTNPVPPTYALITSVGKNEYAVYKGGNEWLVSLNLDLYHVGALGFDYSTILDDVIETVIPKMKELQSPSVIIKNVYLESERDLSFDTATSSVNRKVLTYSIWCNYGN